MSKCVSAYVSVNVCVDWSLLPSLAKSLFPAKSKVGGGCISKSLHYKERWGGGGRMRMEEAFLQQDRKELKHITTQTETLTYRYPHVWHLEKPQCVSTNLFPQENCSTSSSTSPVEPQLLEQTHTLHCILPEESAESSHQSKTTWSHKLWRVTLSLFSMLQKTV